MTVDEPYRREYRYAGGRVWVYASMLPLVAGAAALTWEMAEDDEVPIAVPVIVGAAFTAMFVGLLLAIHVAATICDECHLTVRGVFRRRLTPWRDVQGIEIEANPDRGSEFAPRRIAVLYDVSGGRRLLPHLNDRRPDFTRDVEELREAWLLRRGEAWAPAPEAVARMAQAGMSPTRRPRARWVQVVGWAALVALIIFGAGFALLFFTMGVAGNIDSDDGVAGRILDSILLLLLWLPAVAFAATLVILGIRDLVAMGIRRWR